MSEMKERIASKMALRVAQAIIDAQNIDNYDHVKMAIAAIEAMREPTSEMVRRGENAGYGEIGHKLMQTDGRKFADASYRAMIDVAFGKVDA